MYRAPFYVWVSCLLVGCANLSVTTTSASWTESSKKITATIENRPAFIPLFSRPAENFRVTFDAIEVPLLPGPPQISHTVTRLDTYESVTLEADFTPLANAANYELWNVENVRVTADADHAVSEGTLLRSDNVKNVPVPFSSELPIAVVDTLGVAIPDEPKITADMRIMAAVRTIVLTHGTYTILAGRNYLADPPNNYNGRIGIEKRGQLSATFCKKQYGVETRNLGGGDLQVSLLLLPVEEDWVLHGPYSDKPLMRNVLAYGLSNALGRYAPRTVFVELFVNDPALGGGTCPSASSNNYAGVYVLMERIKRDANRVNVARLNVGDNSEPAITGGYILKKDWVDPGDVTFTTSTASGYGTRLTFVYPNCTTTSCDATLEQKAWIENYVNEFETALKGGNFQDSVNGYAKYIDVDSFVDYYLIQELFKNSDGFRGSTYMHKDRSAKIKMGPVWDMNFTMGNVGWPVARPPNGWLVGLLGDQMRWWGRLLEDPAFAQKVIDRWQALRQTVFSTSNLHTEISKWANHLRYAQARNFKRWPILGVQIVGNPTPVDPNETYQDAVQQVKSWIEARTNWIDANIGALVP